MCYLLSRFRVAASAALLCLVPAAAADAALVTAGLQVHLDADGITGVTSGTGLAAWNDISGNGRNAAQATDTAQPTYFSGASAQSLNGRAVVRFDGTSDVMASTFTGNTFAPSGSSVFVVFRSSATPQQTLVSLRGNTALQNQAFTFINRFSSTGSLFASFDGTSGNNNSSQDIEASATNGAGHVFAATTTTGTGATVTLRADGGAATNSYAEAPVENAVDFYSVGALNNLSTNRLTGDIAEILVYNRALSATEVAENEAYLMQKYSIPEPGSVALMAATGLLALARRRRRA